MHFWWWAFVLFNIYEVQKMFSLLKVTFSRDFTGMQSPDSTGTVMGGLVPILLNSYVVVGQSCSCSCQLQPPILEVSILGTTCDEELCLVGDGQLFGGRGAVLIQSGRGCWRKRLLFIWEQEVCSLKSGTELTSELVLEAFDLKCLLCLWWVYRNMENWPEFLCSSLSISWSFHFCPI